MQDLEACLSESISNASRRESTAFEEIAGPTPWRVILSGAGRLGRRTFSGLRKLGIETICFIDRDPALWGSTVDGLIVLAPAEAAARYGDSAIFIVTIWRAESLEAFAVPLEELRQLGCRRIVPFAFLYWRFPDAFLPYYAVDLPHRVVEASAKIREAFDLLEDARSRSDFVTNIRWRLTFDSGAFSPAADSIYFPPDIVETSTREGFVDCGAFDGDTIRSFLTHTPNFSGKIEAFEPDRKNFERLTGFVASLPSEMRGRIHIQNIGVGARRESVRFGSGLDVSSRVGDGDGQIELVALDDTVRDVATFVKMDIEGHEMEALRGAARLVRERHPTLSICAYHVQDHIWSIPIYLRALSADYRLFLRNHGANGWENVIYAVPGERLV